MFVGRKTELDFLDDKYNTAGGQLIVLYGRRRVGKTETLHEFCKDKEHIFYACAECTDTEQLRSFSTRVLTKEHPAKKYLNEFATWEQALGSVCDTPTEKKLVLVIDEFPYMVKNNNNIPSVLQNLWDISLKNKNIMIILCGSAMSFIEKEILAEKNPLYGRATGILKMTAMNFYDAVLFFPNYSTHDKILAYAILGGIPHYLKQFNDHLSLEDNIKKNILQRGSILYSEVEFLMRQELREATIYNTAIQAIALGNTKLNDIYNKTQIEKNKLNVYLKNLIDLGIVEREFPVSAGIKEQAGAQRGLYRITDNYFRFWYAFVFPNISELEADDVSGVFKYAVKPQLDEYASLIFEDVCREYLRRQNRSNTLPFRFAKIGRWWNKMDEIDIMAANAKGDKILFGECKFKRTAFNLAEMKNLLGKFKPDKQGATVYYYLFSKSGFTKEVCENAETEKIQLVDINELI